MKKIILLLTYFTFLQIGYSQDYVDIVKFSTNNTTLGNIQEANQTNANKNFETSVNNVNFELYYPKKLSEKLVLLTGLTAENTRLNLSKGADRTSLTMTRLNLGLKYQHSEKWSGTYVLLPKIASDFNAIGSNDFQIGALAVLDYQYSESYKIKFGMYSSTENHGSTLTPLIGMWHRSKNNKFYINATLPIRMDANYSLTKNLSIGSDLLTSIKSYNLSEFKSNFYVQEESIRFALYTALGLMDNSLILRGKVGLDTTDYGVFNANEKVGVQVLTFPLSGDKRNRLNAEFDSSLYVGFDAIYRFDLTKNK
jgi:hypothetical protein